MSYEPPVWMSLPDEKYDIIYTDPPWYYHDQIYRQDRSKNSSASKHYNTVKTEDLRRLPVHSIANDNCLLFMWATSPCLDHAIDLGQFWGFQYITVAFVWHKLGFPNPSSYTLSENELCLLFKKGNIPQPRGDRNVRQTIACKRGRHSEKPHETRIRIKKMFPTQSKIEIFARKEVKGWSAWGNEVAAEPENLLI